MTILSTAITWLFWLLAMYAGYVLITSSLPCFPLLRRRKASASPFDHVAYQSDAEGPDAIGLLESPVEGLGLRLSLFEGAARQLDVVCHTIHTGASTSAFFDGIVQAAERGVQVRILLDGKASSIRPSVCAMMRAVATHPNITIRQYNPLHLLKPWKWHFLMHDKYILVDGCYLLLGGRNIGDKFFAPADYTGKVSNDRDVIIHKRQNGAAGDSAVDQAQRYFETMWAAQDTAPLRAAGRARRSAASAMGAMRAQAERFAADHPAYFQHSVESCLRSAVPTRRINVLHNPVEACRKQPWIWMQIARIAREAQSAVLFQTPYVTANRGILSTLEASAARVDLSILTNSAASTPNFPAFSNYYAHRRKFLRTGARLYEYQNAHSIHGKAMVVDGRLGLIGSFNMDDRSMFLDTEIMLAVDSEAFAAMLSGAISAYQAQSLCVNAQNAYTEAEGCAQAAVPVYKVPLLRLVSLFSMPLRSLI